MGDVVAIQQPKFRVDSPGQFRQESHEKLFVDVFAHQVQHEPVTYGAFLDEHLQRDVVRMVLEIFPVPHSHQLKPEINKAKYRYYFLPYVQGEWTSPFHKHCILR